MRDFFNSVGKFFKSDPNKIGNGFLTPLQTAIENEDLKKVRALLAKGADPDLRGRSIHPPLHMALDRGYLLIALELLKAKADVNLADSLGQTPLHYAVRRNQEAFVQALLELKADPNVKSTSGRTPLHTLAGGGIGVVDLLLSHGARINEQDNNGETPLHLFYDDPVLCEALLDRGADPNLRNNEGLSAFAQLLDDSHFRADLLRRMIEAGADLKAVNTRGETVLHLAARAGTGDVFRLALEKGAALEAQDAQGNTVLHTLMGTRNAALISQVLLRPEAPHLVHEANARGLTPLGELLNRADYMVADSDGNYTPVFDKKFMEIFTLLLNVGADINEKDKKGRSILHHAVMCNKTEFMDRMLATGADPDLVDQDGKTALHYAIERGNLRAIDALLDRGANPDMTDAHGWTILDRLAEQGDRDSPVVQRLIVAGGQYQKQLPLYPEMMRRSRILDKGFDKPQGGHIGGPKL